jgi:hypothetical protein
VSNLNTTVGDHETRITDNTNATLGNSQRIGVLEGDDPLAVMHLVNDVDVTLDDTGFIVLPVFDAVVIERGNFNADINSYALISNVAVNACVVSIGLNVQFSGSEILEVQVYVNGQPYSGESFYIKGDGTSKPVALYWQSIVALNDGDVIDLRGKNEASGSFTATFRRTHFSIRSTVKEIV